MFIIYSAVAMTLFGDNDPNHFGSIATSLYTFFEISTFDGWAQVMYINMYGCDQFPSQYEMYNASDTSVTWPQLTYQRHGTMYMPVCHSPKASPILSPLLFMSFVIVVGFILISLTIAVVTSGINDRLDELKENDEVVVNKELLRINQLRHADSFSMERDPGSGDGNDEDYSSSEGTSQRIVFLLMYMSNFKTRFSIQI